MLCTKTPKSYNKVIGVVCKFQFIIHYIRGQIVELLLEQLWFFLCFVPLSYTSKWKWERFQKVSLHIQIRRNIALQLFFGPQSQQPELPVESEEDFPLWKLENGTWKEPSCLPTMYVFDEILTLWCFPSFCFVMAELWQRISIVIFSKVKRDIQMAKLFP